MVMAKRFGATLSIAASVALLPLAAQAHTGVTETGGLTQGFLHPLGGLDHILAMLAVGIWAAQIGGRAVWAIPAAFVAAMIVGGALGLAGTGLPMVEFGIAGSVVLLGALIALRRRLPLPLGMAVVALFAIFHGHAHGAEAPLGASVALYGLGFAAATALLHALGIVVAVGASRLARSLAAPGLRVAGGGIAAAGLVLLLAG